MRRRWFAMLFATVFIILPARAEDGTTPPSRDGKSEVVSENTDKAVKIAGLVAFVASSCPSLAPDYARFNSVISTLGLETVDLAKDNLRLKYLNYAALYQKDVQASCEKAQAMFGDNGTVLAGLFHVK